MYFIVFHAFSRLLVISVRCSNGYLSISELNLRFFYLISKRYKAGLLEIYLNLKIAEKTRKKKRKSLIEDPLTCF